MGSSSPSLFPFRTRERGRGIFKVGEGHTHTDTHAFKPPSSSSCTQVFSQLGIHRYPCVSASTFFGRNSFTVTGPRGASLGLSYPHIRRVEGRRTRDDRRISYIFIYFIHTYTHVCVYFIRLPCFPENCLMSRCVCEGGRTFPDR